MNKIMTDVAEIKPAREDLTATQEKIQRTENRLTAKQIVFCEEYLIDFNGSRSYKKAYPNIKKDSSARVNASRLLAKDSIQAYLKQRKDELFAKLEITSERTLRGYARRAYFDPRSLFDPATGNLIPLHRLPRDVAAAVTKVKIRQLKPVLRKDEESGEEVLLEQNLIESEWDKGDSARDALAKYLGLFEKDNTQKQTNIDIYNQVRAEVEREMVDEAFEKIEQKNKDRDPNVPDLTM